ncbi:hypothetical protein ACIP29_35580 [Streptomyces coelicoflavus]|uniref:hypothetical protein n=1 Tax=Streptomyces coelicoflavus TaxID=285562 RepID=UPI001147697B|nr:hypothetical protein [Streptomyces coelicoflavus]MZE44084.1 hypothetical protein [Streptomyces sp. SID5477]
MAEATRVHGSLDQRPRSDLRGATTLQWGRSPDQVLGDSTTFGMVGAQARRRSEAGLAGAGLLTLVATALPGRVALRVRAVTVATARE